ncbi:MAG: Eco57I restriction-modification methylase domain-containing protein [Spirochaetaceae bacterium]|nr:Eco57I restriction-modification methylase domain-containing protein [Spirochaetaceae bacterium]
MVFTDKNKTAQYWQLPLRESGEEGKVKRLVTFMWRKGQEPESLYQKFRNIVFTLNEEENITLLDVQERIRTSLAANSEKVTKKFYAEFTKQHDAFLAFIKGMDDTIPDKDNVNKKWYASLMMNRLMFCYFIQKKRFLDGNSNYLQDKLKECKKLKGAGNFYGFYRSFLMELFHDELANPKEKRKQKKIPVQFGDIPYLNGGLFETHELEARYKAIAITDAAFENIFAFFDEWEWHLDTRENASGRDINPDVIGYIFEKYINNRADMGAYYTKEDITDYIGKNTIIPFLLEKVKTDHPAPFAPGGGFWQYLQDSGDEYIYDAVKKGGEGCKTIDEVAIPENIKMGIDTNKPDLLLRRKNWNSATPENIGLPTEIWRETIARLERYFALKRKITKGEITEINDLITYNLNIRDLAQDYLEQTADKAFIRKFYKALISITILDPTCGSGAFLFAALNILEPLYEVCLQRMEEFYRKNPKGNADFEDHLLPVLSGEHPSRAYYIYKTIILNNLYGVDLMKEAVEIAKLRLFLKLVAAVDPSRRKKNFGLEPLPDIDFNVRSGNTLVGFATEGQLEGVVKEREPLTYEERYDALKSECEIASASFKHFKRMQTEMSPDSFVIRSAKQDYAKAIAALDEKLNRYLASTYGINPDATKWKDGAKEFDVWRKSHQPFHWFAEFYEIISNGGFDVVIGNPPYIATSKIDYDLKTNDFSCSDIFGYIIKRSFDILNKNARYGFIVMHNLAFSRSFEPTRKIIRDNVSNGWFSFYARIPAGLFSGDVRVRNCVFVLEKRTNDDTPQFHTTRIHRWFTESRETLFSRLQYSSFSFNDVIPMFNSHELSDFFEKLHCKTLAEYASKHSKHTLYFKQSAYNWIAVSEQPAPCYDGNGNLTPQTKVGSISFINNEIAQYSMLFLNGKLSFSFWLTYGDEFDVTKEDLLSMRVPFDELTADDKTRLRELATEFSEGLETTVQYKLNAGKKVGTYNTSRLWHITDKSDIIFLKYMCAKPEEIYARIEDHVSQTILSGRGEGEGEG